MPVKNACFVSGHLQLPFTQCVIQQWVQVIKAAETIAEVMYLFRALPQATPACSCWQVLKSEFSFGPKAQKGYNTLFSITMQTADAMGHPLARVGSRAETVQGIHSESHSHSCCLKAQGIVLCCAEVQLLKYEMPNLGLIDITLFNQHDRSTCWLLLNLR